MTDLRKAAEVALEDVWGAKLCEVNSMSSRAEMLRLMGKAAEALRQALAQPEQHLKFEGPIHVVCQCDKGKEQPKREWVGLSYEERHGIREWQEIQKELGPVWAPMMLYLYLAIEAKLKEKNV